jgi:hypothetical protein
VQYLVSFDRIVGLVWSYYMPKIYEFNNEIAQEICTAIATSSFGIRKLAKQNKHWPSVAHIFRWLHNNPLFREQYTRAKQNQIESFVDDVIDIADDSTNDWMVNANGTTVANHDHINRARLRIDTRKWLASKLAPKIYGDKKDDKVSENDAISQFKVENE